MSSFYIGALMLTVAVLFIVGMIVYAMGIVNALLVFGASAFLSFLIIGGIHLTINGR